MSQLTDRSEYGKYSLDKLDLNPNPIEQLRLWWKDALDAKVLVVDAVCLSTVDKFNRPDGRIVLLKEFDERGLVFFTNYESEKSRQLQENPHASMTIFWPLLERQIRIRGEVQRCSRKESQDYFMTRPRGAKLGAWSSAQSRPIAAREELEASYERMEELFVGQEVPCPDFWGGYRLVPSYFEFWQGRYNRLHDRLCYKLQKKSWLIERLMP